jgi:DNA-binding transcriptional regulator YhcF (GntR family)
MSKELQVEQRILNEILSGHLQPGELMQPERLLAIKYDCSRPVVHKAIIRLEDKGVLKIRPRKGIQILDFKVFGRLSLIEEISLQSKEDLSKKFNHDMLIFIKDNFKNVLQCFESVQKQPTPIQLNEPKDYFNLIFDYCRQCGNGVYPMLINEFRIGILNVATCCIESDEVNRLFQEIENSIIQNQLNQAISLADECFEKIENLWIGGWNV